jgi:hypothetical protein
MGGTITDVTEKTVKINLTGRLGVLVISRQFLDIEPVTRYTTVRFYFSYLWAEPQSWEYELLPLQQEGGLVPHLLGGVLTEVNDTAVKAMLPQRAGTIAVPLRWVFTSLVLTPGQQVSFYMSRIQKKTD